MTLQIGKIYRYSRDFNETVEFVDGLPNYFYYTHVNNYGTKFTLDRGINTPKEVVGADNIKRRPVIVVTSSPHKVGSESTPWQDVHDTDHGYIKYFGDNKNSNTTPESTSGNKTLLKLLKTYQSNERNVRENAVPIVFFERVPCDGRVKGNLKFQGFGIIESARVVTQSYKDDTFTNYVFECCVFSMAKENEKFDWNWIAKRCDKDLTLEETNKYAPEAWKNWLKTGDVEKSRRNVSKLNITNSSAQKPAIGSKEEKILERVMDFYKNKEHKFELLAKEVTKFVLQESQTKYTDGWVTKKSGDKGIDFVLRLDIGQGFAGIGIVLLGQAKCEASATSGKDIARTVARLKRGWIGAYVTASYFSEPVQEEIIEDKYPLIKINGLKIAEVLDRNILMGSNDMKKLDDYLELLEKEYENSLSNRIPEEILNV